MLFGTDEAQQACTSNKNVWNQNRTTTTTTTTTSLKYQTHHKFGKKKGIDSTKHSTHNNKHTTNYIITRHWTPNTGLQHFSNTQLFLSSTLNIRQYFVCGIRRFRYIFSSSAIWLHDIYRELVVMPMILWSLHLTLNLQIRYSMFPPVIVLNIQCDWRAVR